MYSLVIEVSQVGKRWFHCKLNEENRSTTIEATFRNSIGYVVNDSKSTEAGYQVFDWIPNRYWILTGTGSRKYREALISTLEKYLNNITP